VTVRRIVKMPTKAEQRATRRAAAIHYLARRKFPLPDYLVGKDPFIVEELRELVAYQSGRPAHEKEEEATYRADLEALSDGALLKKEKEERVREAIEKHEAQRVAEEGNRPWNLPSAIVSNFGRYVDFPKWTIGTCVALLLERDPKVATWAAVQHAPNSDFAKRFVGLHELIVASVNADLQAELTRSPPGYLIEPPELLRWAMPKTSVAVPPKLQMAIEGKAAVSIGASCQIQPRRRGRKNLPFQEAESAIAKAFPNGVPPRGKEWSNAAFVAEVRAKNSNTNERLPSDTTILRAAGRKPK